MDKKINKLIVLVVSTMISIPIFAQKEKAKKDTINDISEVVVTAMGIKKEVKKLGYDVTEVKGEAVNKVRSANPMNALAGKVAGLNIGASTEMLGRPEIVLRGSKDLLFVVDGVPINSDTWNVNPDDVESYSILKGPNAAALYGFRGINGAIVITTKKGTKDKRGWTVDFNSSSMYDVGFIALPESQHEYGRGTGFKYSYGNVLYDNTQRLPEWGPRFEGQPVQQFDSSWDNITQTRGTSPWLARGVKNFENFVQTGITNTNNISLSTSGENYDARLSYSHLYQQGMFPNTKLNADNFSINLGYKLNDKIKFEGNLNLSLQYSPNIPDVNYGPNSYIYMFKVYGSSDYDINALRDIYKGPQGVQDLMQYSSEYGRLNSAWFMANEWLRSHQKTDIYGYLKATYKINDDLNLSARSQVTTWDQSRTEKVPPSTNLNDYVPWYSFGWYGDYRIDKRNLLENNTDIMLSFNKEFDNWNVSALGGANMRLFKYNSDWETTKGLAIPKLYSLSNTKAPGLAYSWGSDMQVYSAYYSVDFGYKKYFNINTTGRVDNLSTLRKGYNTFFYPSASISSVISDYFNLGNTLSYLKIRGSFADVKGALTASNIGSAYMATTGSSLNSGLLHYGSELYTSYDGPTYANQNAYSNNNYYNGTASVDYSNVIANQELEPYKRISYEAGLDLKLFKNRIGIDATYFRTINGPQIFAIENAPSVGQNYHNINGVTTLNQGFELSLNANIIKNTRGFNWNLSANWSTYKETLKEIASGYDEIWLNGHNYKPGDRLDAYYGTKLVRDNQGNVVHNSAGLLYQAPSGQSQNGLLGHLNPDYSMSITNNLSFKNWSLSFQWDARVGGKVYDFLYAQAMNGGTAYESAAGDFGKARYNEWVSLRDRGVVTPSYIGQGVVIVSGTPRFENGQIVNMNELTFGANSTAVTVQSYVTNLYNNTEYFMVDRSFAKLREASLTYSFPKEFLEKTFLRSLSVAIIGRNLLYFAKRKDMDMDSYAAGYNSADRTANGGKGSVGLQSTSTRTIGFNLNIGF